MLAMEQTLHINPTRDDRKPTNAPFIFIFSLIFFIWIGIAMKVLVGESPDSQDSEDVDENDQIAFNENEEITSDLFLYLKSGFSFQWITLRVTWTFIVCTILSGFIAFFYVYFLSLSEGKFVIDIAVYSICILMISVIAFPVFMLILFSKDIVVHAMLIFSLFCAAYLITSFRCARNVGTKALFEIIKDSSQAVIRCPGILLFTFAMSVAIVLTSIFSVFILNRILLQNSDIQTIINYSIINIYGAKALINFFTNFIHMVISGYVIDWFWTKDQHTSSLTMRRNITRPLCYHLGTLAYASIPLISHLASAIQACRCRDSDKDIVKIYNIFTRFFSQLCVTLYIVDFALIQTSIYGYDYSTAILAAHDLVAQNNHEVNLAVSEVLNVVTVIGYGFITIPFTYEHVPSSMYSTIIPFSIVFTSAVRALLVNKMIIDYTADALKEDRENAPEDLLPQLQTSV